MARPRRPAPANEPSAPWPVRSHNRAMCGGGGTCSETGADRIATKQIMHNNCVKRTLSLLGRESLLSEQEYEFPNSPFLLHLGTFAFPSPPAAASAFCVLGYYIECRRSSSRSPPGLAAPSPGGPAADARRFSHLSHWASPARASCAKSPLTYSAERV
ncbi:hypothetical protein BKA93DRAFT_316951 [Sparassis latifolia]